VGLSVLGVCCYSDTLRYNGSSEGERDRELLKNPGRVSVNDYESGHTLH
jgi:hypothetical protein